MNPCRICKGTRFWRHAQVPSVLVCARCHPPPSDELVAEWVGP